MGTVSRLIGLFTVYELKRPLAELLHRAHHWPPKCQRSREMKKKKNMFDSLFTQTYETNQSTQYFWCFGGFCAVMEGWQDCGANISKRNFSFSFAIAPSRYLCFILQANLALPRVSSGGRLQQLWEA